MAIILDDIDLSGLHTAEPGAVGTPRTVAETALDGSAVVWEGQASDSRIILTGGAEYGWLACEVLERLAAMAAVAGATYDLSIDGRSTRVRFCNEEPPAVTAIPVEPGLTARPQALFRDARIALVEVV